jgi:hypothetical protein
VVHVELALGRDAGAHTHLLVYQVVAAPHERHDTRLVDARPFGDFGGRYRSNCLDFAPRREPRSPGVALPWFATLVGGFAPSEDIDKPALAGERRDDERALLGVEGSHEDGGAAVRANPGRAPRPPDSRIVRDVGEEDTDAPPGVMSSAKSNTRGSVRGPHDGSR